MWHQGKNQPSSSSSASADAELDQQLTGSELLLSGLLQNTVQGSPGAQGLTVAPDGPYDFYQQSNMSVARCCLPVLEQLGAAVKRRLEEWPEHPALLQVSQRPASCSEFCSGSERVEGCCRSSCVLYVLVLSIDCSSKGPLMKYLDLL